MVRVIGLVETVIWLGLGKEVLCPHKDRSVCCTCDIKRSHTLVLGLGECILPVRVLIKE